jgi:ankyrin repeat protein
MNTIVEIPDDVNTVALLRDDTSTFENQEEIPFDLPDLILSKLILTTGFWRNKDDNKWMCLGYLCKRSMQIMLQFGIIQQISTTVDSFLDKCCEGVFAWDDNFEEDFVRVALLSAAENGHMSVFSWIIRKIRNNATLLDIGWNFFLEDILIAAVENNRMDFVKFIVEANLIDIKYKPDFEVYPLLRAANKNNLEMMRYLISKGCDINAVSVPYYDQDNQYTALIRSVSKKEWDAVRILVDAGADLEMTVHGNEVSRDVQSLNGPALSFAVGNNDHEMVQYLITKGARVNPYALHNKTPCYCPFITSVDFGNLPIVKYMVEAGANIEFRNYENMTALILAAVHKNHILVDYLISIGAQTNVVDTYGYDYIFYLTH